MLILSADTSSVHGSVCVAEDEEILGEIRLASSIQHSERLFRSIEFLLQNLPLSLADIDVFVSARGPGSFTGLRIGLAAMAGFVAAHKKTGAGVSTLEALAWNVGPSDALIAPTIDARRGEIYGAIYRRSGDDLVEEQQPVVVKPSEWRALLPDSPVILCGDGAELYQSELGQNSGRTIRKVNPYLAAAMAQLALTSKAGPLEPLYVRKTDAEIQREQRNESTGSPNT